MTDVKEFSSLVDMQRWACATFGDRPAIGTKRDGAYAWTTFAELGELVDAMRAALVGAGVERGDKVAAISNNRLEWAVAAYATYGIGAHFVPMYEAQLEKDWRYILEDAGATVLFVSTTPIYDKTRGMAGKVGRLRDVVCFDAPSDAPHAWSTWLARGRSAPVAAIEPDWDETAGLIYTSGTTGKPKGVVLSHGNFVSNLNSVNSVIPRDPADVSCSFLPWAHSFGQTAELHGMLSAGAAIGVAESVNTLLDDIQLVKPTVLFSVPRVFNRIYDGVQKRFAAEKPVKRLLINHALAVAARRRKLAETGQQSALVELQHRFFDERIFAQVRARFGGRLKFAFSGGAALQREVAEFIDDIGIVVFEGYGLTETSPIATANRPDARRIGTIGKPIPGVSIFVCDEHGHALPQGAEGELVVVGPNVMQGYHNHPESTAEVIFDLDGLRAFKTGDMGCVDPDGFVRITGRFKEQYKLENGKYVVPTPLEDQLKLSGYIDQVFLFGDNRPHNVALVVPDFDACRAWASARGETLATNADVARSASVHELIGAELRKFSGEFKGFESPKRWALLAEGFSTENDLLTPKLSVKRRNVQARYQAELDALYAS
ncbi:MAG: long-chain fatty acid--CoA ligase [Myxococcales bacterium]|nr:long-chain fatty acid--CoA ligase [Myxococcales bacterium]MCB9534466.1 long-chain fatty acid--CoA ligase [Myxococcales bacterium]